MRKILLSLGAIAILTASFFGTLWILDKIDPEPPSSSAVRPSGPDLVRVEHAKTVKAALEKYRSARGSYPAPFTGNPLSALKPHLVDTGYLKAIPEDPDPAPGTSKQYSYASDKGTVYGLSLIMKSGGRCVTGVGASGRGWWSNAPDCPF
ncbi:MAG: hypothetical protein Q7T45_13890 [Bradyrhizobium sp.]|uniref:hypothetical protein n=1 Tax=Bradyrhizobium sp. TaxID=376 RepID=UPI0027264CCA|nr:hypothetical protein [Bradyrhizobium sp.]MDO8398903.1 hypothetical protein [Bradyrhizobium sp.]